MVISALRPYLPDITRQDGDLWNPLMIAIYLGHPDKSMFLLEWYSLNLPLLPLQKDAKGLTVNMSNLPRFFFFYFPLITDFFELHK